MYHKINNFKELKELEDYYLWCALVLILEQEEVPQNKGYRNFKLFLPFKVEAIKQLRQAFPLSELSQVKLCYKFILSLITETFEKEGHARLTIRKMSAAKMLGACMNAWQTPLIR